ncbi:MAG: hypothetical protein ACYS0H_31060, partial [Planctomycetota bacterium]
TPEQRKTHTGLLARKMDRFAKANSKSLYGKAAALAAELLLEPDGSDPFAAFFDSRRKEAAEAGAHR